MESRSYNFSTAKKRSSQLESKVIWFPKEDDHAPRMRILGKECPEQLSVFKTCMAQYGEEAKCSNEKEDLNACGSEAFRMVNNSKEYSF